jgi:PGF-CTERM protein
VETEIQFEDEVVVDEETTVTYVANVVETPVETNVEVELTLLVDGEEVRTQTTEEEVFDGAELRTKFAHTFDCSGEKEVTVDSVTEVFGQRITDSTTETVTVTAAEESDGNESGDSVDDVAEEDTPDDTEREADETEDETGDEMEGDADNQTDGTTDRMEDGAEDNMDDNGTDSDTDDAEDGTSEELPGFGAVAALVSLAAVAVYTGKRRS